MSVIINGERFPIFLQDSETSIKDRYCLEKFTIPALCTFEVKKQSKTDVIDRKKYNVKPLNGEGDNEDIYVTFTKENDYKINPLEGSEVTVKTFEQFYEENDVDESSTISFNYSFNKFAVKAIEIFGFLNKTDVLFSYIILTNSNPDEEEDYSESYERATQDSNSPYYNEMINNKNEYDVYFKNYKTAFTSLKNRVEAHTESSNKFEAFMKILSQVNLPVNVIKTDIKQVEYDFAGTFTYSIDAYDYFNRFIPLKYCPYIRIGKYHKVLGNFKLNSETWFEDFIDKKLEQDENTIQMFMYGKETIESFTYENPSYRDFFLVQLTQTSEEKGKFFFNIKISINDDLELKENNILERVMSSLLIQEVDEDGDTIIPIELTLKKTFGNGYFIFKNFDLPDEMIFDSCLNDPDINNLITIDENYKIHKERGGIKFFMTTNNLESSIKCSLIKKVIDIPNRPEVKAFPGIINVKDHITLIKIIEGSSMVETIRLVELLVNCFSYIYNNKKKFYDYYDKYMTKLDDLEKVSKKVVKKDKNLRLKDIYPQIFISGYPRMCQPTQPIIISEEEFNDDLDNGLDAMIYPRKPEEGPQDYYSCKHDKEYSFVGVKENTLKNRDQYPYLPCCFATPQTEQKKLRYLYERNLEDEKEEGFNEVITSKKILKERQFGILPDNIAHTFNIIHDSVIIGSSRFLRLGVRQSPDSVLYALIAAKYMGTDKKIKNDLSNVSYSSIRSIREKIYNMANYNITSQSGLFPQDIKKIIKENLNIDPIFFLELLEDIFEVNIIIFCRDRIFSKDGTICNPDFKKNFILNTRKTKFSQTVILYRTNGGESDIVPYVHTELVIYEPRTIKENAVNYIQVLFNTKDKFISELYAIHYSHINTNYITFNLTNKISGQIEDGNGKIRVLYVNFEGELINILTSPCPNFSLKQFSSDKVIYDDKDIKNIEPSKIIAFFLSEGINNINKIVVHDKVTGLYGKKGDLEMYIPCYISVQDFSKIPGSIKDFDYYNKELPAPTSLTFSLLKQYNTFLRLSNYITAYSQFLFSTIYSDDLKILRLNITQDNQSKLIKDLLQKFNDNNIYINETHNYGELKRGMNLGSINIIKNKTNLILTSETIKKKIMYMLYIQMKHNISNLIMYKDKKYVDKFYTSSKDFDLKEHYNIFYTVNEVKLYMIPIENQYKVYSSIPDKNTFYYKTTQIDEDVVFKATRMNNIENCLFIAYNWEKKQSVSLYSTNTINPNSVNFIVYEAMDENTLVEHEFINNNKPVLLRVLMVKFKDEETKFYALLPVE
jgi:hypothetical protein